MSIAPRVLVALIGETRATELTADSFRSNLLDPLGADLALCVRAGEEPNPLYEWASHVWTLEEPADWGALYDAAAGSSDWRVLLEVGHHLFGGIDDANHPQVGKVALLHYYRRLLWKSIERAGIAGDYDWIVLTRSDFMWPVQHPHVRHLSTRRLYVLDGEQYGGVCDRHFVIPRRYFKPVLRDLVEPIFTDPKELKLRIDRVAARWHWSNVNMERFLAMRIREVGLWHRMRYLPYVPYAVRPPGGRTAWSVGVFDENEGYYVKYPTERQASEIAQRYVGDQDSWQRYLSPLRGVARRRSLRNAYREHGLYQRAFSRRYAATRALQRARLTAESKRYDAEVALGRGLRRVPGFSVGLDRRAGRRRVPAAKMGHRKDEPG
ncbi:MAG: hypothetical protein ACXWFN_07985 [Solirubrobacterales bacterium]